MSWAKRNGVPTGTSLAGMLARKPPMLVMAPANRMDASAWALILRAESTEPNHGAVAGPRRASGS